MLNTGPTLLSQHTTKLLNQHQLASVTLHTHNDSEEESDYNVISLHILPLESN